MANYKAKFTPQEKRAFGERLRRLMLEKEMSGADVARAASKHLRKALTRQLMSSYVSGVTIPNETNLGAIEKALSVPTGTLLMRDRRRASGAPPPPDTASKNVNMTMTPDGKMHLILNVEVPQATGRKIMELLWSEGL